MEKIVNITVVVIGVIKIIVVVILTITIITIAIKITINYIIAVSFNFIFIFTFIPLDLIIIIIVTIVDVIRITNVVTNNNIITRITMAISGGGTSERLSVARAWDARSQEMGGESCCSLGSCSGTYPLGRTEEGAKVRAAPLGRAPARTLWDAQHRKC